MDRGRRGQRRSASTDWFSSPHSSLCMCVCVSLCVLFFTAARALCSALRKSGTVGRRTLWVQSRGRSTQRSPLPRRVSRAFFCFSSFSAVSSLSVLLAPSFCAVRCGAVAATHHTGFSPPLAMARGTRDRRTKERGRQLPSRAVALSFPQAAAHRAEAQAKDAGGAAKEANEWESRWLWSAGKTGREVNAAVVVGAERHFLSTLLSLSRPEGCGCGGQASVLPHGSAPPFSFLLSPSLSLRPLALAPGETLRHLLFLPPQRLFIDSTTAWLFFFLIFIATLTGRTLFHNGRTGATTG